jgi:thiol-disulfide isomerase/thioredoxin
MVRQGGEGRRRTAEMVLLALTLLAPPVALAQGEVIGIAVGQTPPPVTIEDLDGRPVDLSRWIGKKPVLIEFWATWCPVCEELLPRLETAHKKFGASVEFLVVAVAVNQTQNSIKRHVARHPLPFTTLWDVNGNATRAFQAPATSYIVILDASGKVVYTGIGEEQDLEAALFRTAEDAGGRR